MTFEGDRLVVPPGGARSLRNFDPDQTAALDLDMWQAYYAKQNFRLFRGLVRLTRDQVDRRAEQPAIQRARRSRGRPRGLIVAVRKARFVVP